MDWKGIIFVLIGIAVLGGLFVVFKPEPAPVPEAALTAPVAVGEAASVAVTPSVAVDPAENQSSGAQQQPVAPAVPVAPVAASPKVFKLRVEQGRLVEGPAVIRVKQGEELRIQVTSDVDDELHLHGYDKHLHLDAGKPATLTLTAKLSGRFEFELHKKHIDLGALEVIPD